MKLDHDGLDALIHLMGELAVLELLTPREATELDTHMRMWAKDEAGKEGKSYDRVIGCAEWYIEKRRVYIEIVNRRPEQ